MSTLIVSVQLRLLIIDKIKRYDISVVLLCNKLGITYTAFNRYLDEKFSEESFNRDRIKITEEDLFKVCKELGIEIVLKIVVDDNFKPDKEILKTTQVFNKNRTRLLNDESKIDF